MEHYNNNESFWADKKDYPIHWQDPKRFFCDLGMLIPLAHELHAEKVRDISCGLGNHGKALIAAIPTLELLEFYDFNHAYIHKLEDEGYNANKLDLNEYFEFYEGSDLDYCLGSLHYITNDKPLINLFKQTGDNLLIRVPITETSERIEVDKYSDELQSNYRATYRTKEEYLNLIRNDYKFVQWRYAFDESFDSTHGTRQIYILCQRQRKTPLAFLAEWGHWLG